MYTVMEASMNVSRTEYILLINNVYGNKEVRPCGYFTLQHFELTGLVCFMIGNYHFRLDFKNVYVGLQSHHCAQYTV